MSAPTEAPSPAPPTATATADPTGRASATGWAALAAVVAVALVHLSPAVGLAPGALGADVGIQYFLGGETARGAIPLIDFEHTWNVGSWWFNAALFRLADGDPSVWLYLWARVFGPALAAVTAVGILWRLRWRPEWLLVGAGTWLALSHVIHAKYTIPVVWAFVLLPTGRTRSRRADVTARAVLAGLTALSQVELAVLLGAGVILFDLAARDELPIPQRLLRAAAVPAGIAVALGLQLLAYQTLGQPPAEILRQLFSNAAETAEGFTYGYPVLSAPSLRPKLFPASLLIAFVPLIWTRLSPAARLVACLHLCQALIAIRRPDPAHVDAATTLLGLLVVLVVHDLVTDPRGRGPIGAALRRLRPTAATAAGVLGGAAVVAAALAVGFGVPSLLAVVVPTGVAGLAALWTGRRVVPTSGSVGAAAAIALLLLASTAGGITASLRSGDALQPVSALADQLADPLDACTGGDRVAWVVPEPLPLYTELGLTNPTPWTVFWYGFAAEHDRVRAMLDEGAIPAIVQVGAWPASFGGLPADVEAAMTPCTTLETTPIGAPVTVWVAD